MSVLTHLDASGAANMVDVSDKAATTRTAVAEGVVIMLPETLRLIREGDAKKGDVIGTARIAGIMAAKRTHELIPLCHPLLLSKVRVDCEPDDALPGLRITAEVKVQGPTGVEMEALTAVSIACLTVYDMVKAADRGMRIEGIRLLAKDGGRSGTYRAEGGPVSGLIPVAEALARILASVEAPVPAETVPLTDAAGRTLAENLSALRTQPPFPASAMDGYAVRAADLAQTPATLTMIGTSAAGHGFAGKIGPGETVRIFTGAPVPEGADAILIQENADAEGDRITAREPVAAGRFLRAAGLDFSRGDPILAAGETLDARRLALAAAAGHAGIAVRRRPRVAILATGDELVAPGEAAAWDQIVASNTLALAALTRSAGGEPIDLGIARDDREALVQAFRRAKAEGADLLVTLGGASVGDHDLVQAALASEGLELGFWKVALRPGKPLMHGRLGGMLVIGLPGNPVSSIVCGLLFVVPAIRALLGDPQAGADRGEPGTLGRDLGPNDERADYLRARLDCAPDRVPVVHPENRQDSSMLSVLGRAEALLVRAPNAPAEPAGAPCRIIRLDRGLL